MTRNGPGTDETHLTPQQARQGRTTGHVRVILATSLALAIIAGLAFVAYYN